MVEAVRRLRLDSEEPIRELGEGIEALHLVAFGIMELGDKDDAKALFCINRDLSQAFKKLEKVFARLERDSAALRKIASAIGELSGAKPTPAPVSIAAE